MRHNTELIVDQNGIEILVAYEFEKSPAFYEEEGNPSTLVPSMVLTELESVEVIIKGRGINILPMLYESEKEAIIEMLTYEI